MKTIGLFATAAVLLAVPLAHAEPSIPGLRVIAADPNGVSLEFRLDAWSLEPVMTPAGPMSRVTIDGFSTAGAPGHPALPSAGAWLAIPPTGGATLRVIEEQTELITGVDIVPEAMRLVSRLEPEPVASAGTSAREIVAAESDEDEYFDRHARVYSSSDPYPEAVASLDSPTWLRFQHVVALRLAPVRCVAASRELLVTRRLVVRVEFSAPAHLGAADLAAAGRAPAPEADGVFEGIYRGALLNYEPGRAWRSRPLTRPAAPASRPPSRPRAPETVNTEWKVRIDTTGVWQVSYQQLAARGWPSGVAVGAVTASLRDTTTALEPVPWTRTEIPIDVVDTNANGLFDAGDFVVMPVRTWAERTSPTRYERRCGDYEVVWLSYKSAGLGLRLRTRPGWYAAAHPSTPRSFQSFRHYERQYQYDPAIPSVTTQDQFFWTDGFSDATPIDSLTADLPDLDTAGGDVSVSAAWFGRRVVSHAVNGTWVSQVGETPLWIGVTFSGKTPLVLQQSFSASLASSGTNRLRISGNSPSPSIASFDWFEVTYPRFFAALDNRLECNSAGASDTVELRVKSFTAGTQPVVHAYDVTDWGDPVKLVVGPDQVVPEDGAWSVLLQDTVPAGRTHEYVVAVDVRSVRDQAITAEVPSSLYATPASGADFVIIAYDAFANALEPLANFRRSQGTGTLVAKVQDVYDEFNGGRKSLFAIRRFLRYALTLWNTRAVLLVGDASEDAQGWLGTSDVDYVPTPVINEPIGVYDGYSIVNKVVPTDNWYALALVDGDPGTNLLPDMIVGRWTAGSVADVEGLVSKSIAYETTHLGEPWRGRAVLVADDLFSSGFTLGGGSTEYCAHNYNGVFEDISHFVSQIITQEGGFGGYDIRPYDLTDFLTSVPRFAGTNCDTARNLLQTQLYTRNAVSPALLRTLAEGAAFFNFQGYGNASVLTHENLFLSQAANQDLDAIANTGRPWIFTGFTAFANNFANVSERASSFGDAMGERMVNAAGKGAIASFSSTAFEVLPLSVSDHLNDHVYRAFFVDLPGSSAPPARVVIGEGLALGVARMVASSSYSLERGAALTYELLGDPLAALWISGNVGVTGPTVEALSLDALRPSPARGSATIAFALPTTTRARLALYDIGGRLVRVLVDGPLSAGGHHVRWDGLSSRGEPVGPGVYFCRLEAGGGDRPESRSRRIVWLR